MAYTEMTVSDFFGRVRTESAARELVWKLKFEGKRFDCPHCGGEEFWQYRSCSEIRKCKGCRASVRLRARTIFENSKIAMLVWVRAVFLVVQGKRGVSALELKRQLQMSCYETAWTMLHKIREALRQRDEAYKLKELIELDGAMFGNRMSGNQISTLIGVERREWINENGLGRSRAGFAKVLKEPESQASVQKFVHANVEKGSTLLTDGSGAYTAVSDVTVEQFITAEDRHALNIWHPWVHKFISNAKAWLLGTHHGVDAKYLGAYLAEYTYRFNRRHDLNGLFHRALRACAVAQPVTAGVLFR